MELRQILWPAVAFGIALLLAPAGIALYRHLFSLRTDARSALAQIEEQMHRRHAILNRLAEGAPEEHKPGLPPVPAGPSAIEKAAHERTTRTLLATLLDKLEDVEETMLDDLERTKMKIDFAAQYYNDVVERYNRKLHRGPGRIARLTGFKPHEPFDLED